MPERKRKDFSHLVLFCFLFNIFIWLKKVLKK